MLLVNGPEFSIMHSRVGGLACLLTDCVILEKIFNHLGLGIGVCKKEPSHYFYYLFVGLMRKLNIIIIFYFFIMLC